MAKKQALALDSYNANVSALGHFENNTVRGGGKSLYVSQVSSNLGAYCVQNEQFDEAKYV